jgi:hypothetical protein
VQQPAQGLDCLVVAAASELHGLTTQVECGVPHTLLRGTQAVGIVVLYRLYSSVCSFTCGGIHRNQRNAACIPPHFKSSLQDSHSLLVVDCAQAHLHFVVVRWVVDPRPYSHMLW